MTKAIIHGKRPGEFWMLPDRSGVPAHLLADYFPAMPPEDFAELVADVKANGVKVPVALFKNGTTTLLDGRHRLAAAQEAGRKCPAILVEGDPKEYVWKVNVTYRRHLSPAERALAYLRLEAWADDGNERWHKADVATGARVNPSAASEALSEFRAELKAAAQRTTAKALAAESDVSESTAHRVLRELRGPSKTEYAQREGKANSAPNSATIPRPAIPFDNSPEQSCEIQPRPEPGAELGMGGWIPMGGT